MPKTTAKRQRNTEGSYMQRADGLWRFAYSDAQGRRRTLYAAMFAGLQAKTDAAFDMRRKGLPTETVRLTVNELRQEWLADVRPTARSNTFDCYEPQVRLHLSPALGRLRVSKLQPEHLSRYYAEKLTSGLSPRTVLLQHRVISMALKQALRRGHVSRNVAELVDPPRQIRHELRILTPEQARLLLDSLDGDRLSALFVVALATGMRRGELCALQWRDVHLDDDLLDVRATLTRVKGTWERTEPKTASSQRGIRLPRSPARRYPATGFLKSKSCCRQAPTGSMTDSYSPLSTSSHSMEVECGGTSRPRCAAPACRR